MYSITRVRPVDARSEFLLATTACEGWLPTSACVVSNSLAPCQAKPRRLLTPQQLVGDSRVTHSPTVARPTEMTHWPEPRRLSANPPSVGVRRSILTKPGLDSLRWRVLEVCMTFPMPSSGHMPSLLGIPPPCFVTPISCHTSLASCSSMPAMSQSFTTMPRQVANRHALSISHHAPPPPRAFPHLSHHHSPHAVWELSEVALGRGHLVPSSRGVIMALTEPGCGRSGSHYPCDDSRTLSAEPLGPRQPTRTAPGCRRSRLACGPPAGPLRVSPRWSYCACLMCTVGFLASLFPVCASYLPRVFSSGWLLLYLAQPQRSGSIDRC